MLDLVFLVLMLIVLIMAVNGKYNETLGGVATVVGIVAAVAGIIMAFIKVKSSNSAPFFLNVIVFFIALFLRPFARKFVELYENKKREERERLLASVRRNSRESANELPPVYNDDNFDDPELRFGKGGYTDSDR